MATLSASLSIIGLDGVERAWGDVFADGYVGGLGDSTRAGYVVRRTRFGGSPHTDVAQFPAERYADALEAVRPLRLEDGGYGVIDSLHERDGVTYRLNG